MLSRPRSSDSEIRSDMNWLRRNGRKDLQDQPIIEGDDEIGAGREQVRIGMGQSETARDVECRRQAL